MRHLRNSLALAFIGWSAWSCSGPMRTRWGDLELPLGGADDASASAGSGGSAGAAHVGNAGSSGSGTEVGDMPLLATAATPDAADCDFEGSEAERPYCCAKVGDSLPHIQEAY